MTGWAHMQIQIDGGMLLHADVSETGDHAGDAAVDWLDDFASIMERETGESVIIEWR